MSLVLELFSGTAIFSRVAERDGWDTCRVDHDPCHTPTHCVDIATWDYAATGAPTPDHIHAGFDCTTFSMAAHGLHRLSKERASRLGLRPGLPISPAAERADALLARVLRLIAHFAARNPCLTFSVENPKGYMRYHAGMQLLRRAECTYASYDAWPAVKPTDVFTNYPLALCKDKRKASLSITGRDEILFARALARNAALLDLGVDVSHLSRASQRSAMPPSVAKSILDQATVSLLDVDTEWVRELEEVLAAWEEDSRYSMLGKRKRVEEEEEARVGEEEDETEEVEDEDAWSVVDAMSEDDEEEEDEDECLPPSPTTSSITTTTTTMGTGGCAAVALWRLGFLSSLAEAEARAECLCVRENVWRLVREAGWTYHPLPSGASLHSSGCYLVLGLVNDRFLQHKTWVRFARNAAATGEDASSPRTTPDEWRHVVAVKHGRVYRKYLPPLSCKWLWLDERGGTTPDPDKGYLHRIEEVYELRPVACTRSRAKGRSV